MTFWIVLWKSVFIVVLSVFAAMAVWVTVAGFKDIKKLFAKINTEHKESAEAQESKSPDN